ncbi:MAG: 5-deoxy-glucuronate isomerase, partial [Planctomycetes bacterium]|nr:5-deoxy-glucuronate isomerase [Planctomycetota bacterium]
LVTCVTPQSAGWGHVGFELHRLRPGDRAGAATGGREVCLVFVSGKGVFATLNKASPESDVLARIDLATGQATEVGSTGFRTIEGLGFWEDRIFGFTVGKDVLGIDPTTGVATVRATTEVAWTGAGVTTIAPVID